MVPIKLNGLAIYGLVIADHAGGLRIRISTDDAEHLGLSPGRQVRVETPDHTGHFLLTAADETPPLVWLRLLPLASRIAS